MTKLSFFLVISTLIFFSCSSSIPKRQLAFYNDSERTLNIIIEDAEYSYYDEFLEPHSTSFYYSDTGTFDFIVYEANGDFLREVLEVKISENTGSSCNYLWTDLEGKYPAVVVNFNSLYGTGSTYAESIRKFQSKELIHYYIADTKYPFTPNIVYQCEMVNPYEGIPNQVDAGDNVYGIVPLNQGFRSEEALYDYLSTYIEKYN